MSFVPPLAMGMIWSTVTISWFFMSSCVISLPENSALWFTAFSSSHNCLRMSSLNCFLLTVVTTARGSCSWMSSCGNWIYTIELAGMMILSAWTKPSMIVISSQVNSSLFMRWRVILSLTWLLNSDSSNVVIAFWGQSYSFFLFGQISAVKDCLELFMYVLSLWILFLWGEMLIFRELFLVLRCLLDFEVTSPKINIKNLNQVL